MLKMMGMIVITSDGEGEAMCAKLNHDGVVDGCFTQDSDAFLYGAQRVFRNFRVTNDKGQTVGSFDVFDMNRIRSTLFLDREHLIAFALLVGCDYNEKGVPQVGKKKALELLTELWINSDQGPLQRYSPINFKVEFTLFSTISFKLNNINFFFELAQIIIYYRY